MLSVRAPFRAGVRAAALVAVVTSVAAAGGVLAACSGPGGSDSAPPAEGNPMARFDAAVARFERAPLAHLPTPFEELTALAAELGGPRLFTKRDDQTGLAFGGNKARKLDFILADAKARGSDRVITWAGVQSNWARMTAAGARRLGMEATLVLQRREGQPTEPADGNLLLDRLLGAEVVLLEPDADREAEVERVVAAARADGGKPYVVGVGGSRTGHSMEHPLGAVAYANGFRELLAQARDRGVEITHVVHASGSGSTQAGLVVGAAALAPGVEIIGISSGGAKEASERNVLEIARQTVAAMDLPVEILPERVTVLDDYVGEGYGVVDRRIVEAIALVARTEGLLLDPVYTGKALTGLIGLIESGELGPEDTVVFLHTGGTPALFPYRRDLLDDLPATE